MPAVVENQGVICLCFGEEALCCSSNFRSRALEHHFNVLLIEESTGAINDGCWLSEVSLLCCEDVGLAVSGVVDAFVLAAEVGAPVGVEVAGGDEGAEFQDGLGAFESPSGARYVHSVLDDVPARPFDYPGGDGPAFAQRGGVVQVVLLVLQVAGAFAGAAALGPGVAVRSGPAADPCRDLPCFAVQDPAGLGGDPFLGGGLALSKKDQAAFHRYSRTWIRSMMIVTVTPRAAASAVTASIWVLLPSMRTTHSRSWPGSRRPASSKAHAITAGCRR